MVTAEELGFETLYDQYSIRNRISTLARFLNEDYEGETVTLLCVMKGAVNFFSDLSLMLNFDVRYEFVTLQSYEGTSSSGSVNLIGDLPDMLGKKVLIVEDIVDTGLTSDYLMSIISEEADDVKLCTLLSKPTKRKVDIEPDYVGFEIEDLFVVGYGLDYNQMYRNLPCIAVLNNASETRANFDTASYNINVNQQ